MKCCSNCFRDQELSDRIETRKEIGDCDFCGKKNTCIFELCNPEDPVATAIIWLIEHYEISTHKQAKELKYSLQNDWDIFNPKINEDVIQSILIELSKRNPGVLTPDILSKRVMIPQFADDGFLNEFGVTRGKSWQEFSDVLKYENRFHNKCFNSEACASFLTELKEEKHIAELYRARISESSKGFCCDEMGVPPKSLRSPGRINSDGVGVLYLASDIETALTEVRAGVFDYVTIGTFKQSERNKGYISLINLPNILKLSPFLYQEDEDRFLKYGVNRKIFKEIESEMARPLRRSDSKLTYIPTQYISDFIRLQGCHGICYASTLRQGGINIALFDETLLQCVKTETREVSEIKYQHNLVVPARIE
jgi:hypothetical protein